MIRHLFSVRGNFPKLMVYMIVTVATGFSFYGTVQIVSLFLFWWMEAKNLAHTSRENKEARASCILGAKNFALLCGCLVS